MPRLHRPTRAAPPPSCDEFPSIARWRSCSHCGVVVSSPAKWPMSSFSFMARPGQRQGVPLAASRSTEGTWPLRTMRGGDGKHALIRRRRADGDAACLGVRVASSQPTGILEVPVKRATRKAAAREAPAERRNMAWHQDLLSQGGRGSFAPTGSEKGEARTGKLSAHCDTR